MPPSSSSGYDGAGHRSPTPSRPRYSYDGASRPRYTPSPLSAGNDASDRRRYSVDQNRAAHRPPPVAWQNRAFTPALTENDFYEERRLGDLAGEAAHVDAMDSVSAVHDAGLAGRGSPFYGRAASPYGPYSDGMGYARGPPTSYSWPNALPTSGPDGYPATASEPGQFYAPHPGSARMYEDPYAQGPDYFYQPPPMRPQSVASSSAYTLAHPPSLYPASPMAEAPPSIFGVQADHHGLPSPNQDRSRARDNLPSFPSWNRNWYDGHMSANGHAYTAVPPGSGASGWESETLTRSGRAGAGFHQPYGNNPRESADFVKEERVRMLEKKFGKPKISHRGEGDKDDEGDGEEQVKHDPDADLYAGQVTSKGSIKMPWPKTYLAIKVLLVLVALVAFIMALLVVLMIKPVGDAIPAIKSSPISWALHVGSLLSFLLMTWLFLFRPCCCDSGRSAARNGGAGLEGGAGAGGLGGMVIPVLGGQGGPGNRSGKGIFGRKKNAANGATQMGTTVNLIVDPSMLGGANGGGHHKKKRRSKKRDMYDEESEDSDEDADEDDADDVPGAFRSHHHRRKSPLEMLKQRRLHAVALSSLRRALTFLTLFSLVLLALLIALFAFSGGKATTCKSPGTSWCLCWSVELACNILVEIGILSILVLGWWGYQKARRAMGRNGPGGAVGAGGFA